MFDRMTPRETCAREIDTFGVAREPRSRAVKNENDKLLGEMGKKQHEILKEADQVTTERGTFLEHLDNEERVRLKYKGASTSRIKVERQCETLVWKSLSEGGIVTTNQASVGFQLQP
jgi:hypothetical protein